MLSKIAPLETAITLPPVIFLVLLTLAVLGCGSTAKPPSPEGQAFKKEISGTLRKLQQSLSEPMAKGNMAKINAILDDLSQKTAGICIDCPYKTAVLNKEGTLITTFPSNEVVGRNFSSYKMVSEPLRKQKITQSLAYLAGGAKIYFISAPVLDQGTVTGVVVLALTPQDVGKWRLEEKEFLSLDLNTPDNL